LKTYLGKVDIFPDAHWDIEVESRLINLRCQVGVGFSFSAEICPYSAQEASIISWLSYSEI